MRFYYFCFSKPKLMNEYLRISYKMLASKQASKILYTITDGRIARTE